jgi:hypothetical protein
MDNRFGQRFQPGRPNKNPLNKVGQSIRALTTIGIKNKALAGAKVHGIILSDYLRLALFNQLKADGLVEDIDREDDTFETLRQAGQL